MLQTGRFDDRQRFYAIALRPIIRLHLSVYSTLLRENCYCRDYVSLINTTSRPYVDPPGLSMVLFIRWTGPL